MLNRPSHIVPLLLDVRDPDFPAQCIGMTNQMRSEMCELIALTKNEIATTKNLLVDVDRLLARR